MDVAAVILGGLSVLTSGAVAVYSVRAGRKDRQAERWLADRRSVYSRFLAQAREFRDEIDGHHNAPGDNWLEGYDKNVVILGTELLEELGLIAPRDIYAVARSHLDALATASVRKAWLRNCFPVHGEEQTPAQKEMSVKHSASVEKYRKMADETREQLLEMMRADLGVDVESAGK